MPLSSETGIEAGLQRRSHANFLQWLKHNQNTLFTALTGSFIVLSFISPVNFAGGVNYCRRIQISRKGLAATVISRVIRWTTVETGWFPA